MSTTVRSFAHIHFHKRDVWSRSSLCREPNGTWGERFVESVRLELQIDMNTQMQQCSRQLGCGFSWNGPAFDLLSFDLLQECRAAIGTAPVDLGNHGRIGFQEPNSCTLSRPHLLIFQPSFTTPSHHTSRVAPVTSMFPAIAVRHT